MKGRLGLSQSSLEKVYQVWSRRSYTPEGAAAGPAGGSVEKGASFSPRVAPGYGAG